MFGSETRKPTYLFSETGSICDCFNTEVLGSSPDSLLGEKMQKIVGDRILQEVLFVLDKKQSFTNKIIFASSLGDIQAEVKWSVDSFRGDRCIKAEFTLDFSADVFAIDKDKYLARLLSTVSEPSKIKINASKWDSGAIAIDCGEDEEKADILLREWTANPPKGKPKHLHIWVGGTFYGTTHIGQNLGVLPNTLKTAMTTILDPQTMHSNWAKQNLRLLDSIGGTIIVYSTDADSGYRYLAIKPELSEGRLNKPINQSLLQPLRIAEESVAMPREAAIKQAIASGSSDPITYTYEHNWMGAVWRFQGTVFVPDGHSNEVVVKVEDNPHDPRAYWQQGYWKNLIK